MKVNSLLKTVCMVLLAGTILHAGGNIKKEVEVSIPETIVEEDKNLYAGLGLSASFINSEIYDRETVPAITAKVGYSFHKNLAVELRGSAGIKDGSEHLSHSYSLGLYLRPQYPVNEDLLVYGLLGYAQSKITLDTPTAVLTGVDDSTKQNGFSFGAGVDYTIKKDWSIFVDVIRYMDDDTTKPEGKYAIKVDTVTFGVAYHF